MRSIMAGKQDGVFVTLYILLFSFSCRPLFFYYTHTQQQQQKQQQQQQTTTTTTWTRTWKKKRPLFSFGCLFPVVAVIRQCSFSFFVWPLLLHALRCLPAPFFSLEKKT